MSFEHLPQWDAIQNLGRSLPDRLEALIDLCIAVQQIPAPTGAEEERAAWVEGRFRALGLADVKRDQHQNVFGRIPGAQLSPALMVSAHTDTVFPAETDLSIRRLPGGLIAGPGIGDNSTGVAGLIALAELLQEAPQPPVDIWLVANSQEEGLGDLKGMRAAVDRLAPLLGGVLVLEGMGLGRVVHQGLAVRRFRISAQAPGGHSWGDFGAGSAIHALVELAGEIVRMRTPEEPRTTFNIGRIGGGTSVNTIAQEAWLELDLRSTAQDVLLALVAEVQQMVARSQQQHDQKNTGVKLQTQEIGNRPGGDIPESHPLVQAASKALRLAGVAERRDVRISSTDANVPLSRGIPALCIGLTEGGDAHRLSEWINPQPLPQGMQQLLYLTWWSAAWLTACANET